jgi:hypothetical protein
MENTANGIMFSVEYRGSDGRLYWESRLCPSRVEDRKAFALWCAQTGLERHSIYAHAIVREFDGDDPYVSIIAETEYDRDHFLVNPQTMPANY